MSHTAVSPAPGAFDFGLTAEQEARARRLHESSQVIDMLFQMPGGSRIFDHLPDGALASALEGKATLWERYGAAFRLPFDLALKGESQVVRDWWRQSGLTTVSIGVPVTGQDEKSKEGSDDWILQQPWVRLVTTIAEIRQAKADGVLAVYGNCQPTYGLPRELDAIDRAYAKGLRSLMLTYNRMDHVGVGCTERIDAGLSNFGVDVVARCNDLGVIVDTSHCGRLTTLDACKFSKAPVTANHASASAVHAHARGKSDEELEAIAATDGVVGVVAVPFFLASGKPTIEAMLDHIDHIARRVGWRHAGIGTDWPLQAPEDLLVETVGGLLPEIGFRPEDNIDVRETLVGFSDYRDVPNLTRGLVKRGYDDEQIRGILGENFLRVFEKVCG
ncbi:MAG TPA: membrane dipeptidase [Phenylobacterium sp.]|uniref:dipeptidase n=1 Tax=Phenylobacterium sp. TaxID=1871053 RepID=UPI002D600A2D|nr:membrane dipeptidase [Phenylobacterium sp.]HZZ69770.1 membrane dipeptidase [Phenylobacterium sp.]